MNSPILKSHGVFILSGWMVLLFLTLGASLSQAKIKCDLEKENMCRFEKKEKDWSIPEERQLKAKSKIYDQYAHRQEGCGPEGMPSGEMGCMRGRHQGRHGMMGRHHQSDSPSTAQCPQERNTATAPLSFSELINPLEQNPGNIEQGRLLYQQSVEPSCVLCHGRAGDGLGQMGAALVPPPRNFTCAETMDSVSDGQLFWIIKNGSEGTGMPGFGHLPDDSIWKLVNYIRQFSRR